MAEGYDDLPAYHEANAPSAPPAEGGGSTNGVSTNNTRDLDLFFNKNPHLPLGLKHNLISLGVTSLDKLLLMDDSQILLFGNLDKFDSSLSTDLILLIGALKKHKEEKANGYPPRAEPIPLSTGGQNPSASLFGSARVPLSTDPGPGILLIYYVFD